MNIGIVSDTHMPRTSVALPVALRRGLRSQRVGLILHLGDFTRPVVAGLFEDLAPFDAVAGNNDGEEIVRRFGRRKILDVEGLRIGMTHGDGAHKSTLQRALDAFHGERLDVILFGHSHVPYCARHGDVWLLNPGSPTDKRRAPTYSWGLLQIRDGRATPTLHHFADKDAAA